MDTDEGLGSVFFAPNPEDQEELADLNEIRQHGWFDDIIGCKLLERIQTLQNPMMVTKKRKKGKK